MTATETDHDQTTALPPIGGVPYPEFWEHAPWCDQTMHRNEWEARIEYGKDEPEPCWRETAAAPLPEARRFEGTVTRARQEGWTVHMQRDRGTCPSSWGITTFVADPVVVLGQGPGAQPVWKLLPGEARSLAAALLRAADTIEADLF